MSVEGVDYSDARPNAHALYSAGKHFVCRYVGPGGASKHLTSSEARALSAAGLWIVANAEGSSRGALNGYSQGVSDAHAALNMANGCGMPSGRPIYFSVDWDVQPWEWSNVKQYFAGVASVLPWTQIGIYGGLHACLWAKRDRIAHWFWQTYAWSGGTWMSDVDIQQYHNGVIVAGASVDLNRAMTQDYGQWQAFSNKLPVSPPLLPEGKKMFIANQGDDFYVCNGQFSRPITRAQLGDLKTLVQEGHVDVDNIDSPRSGWYEGAFGVILSVDVNSLASQLEAFFATHPATDTLTAGQFRKALTALGATFDAEGSG